MKDPRLSMIMEHNVRLRAYIIVRVFTEFGFQPRIFVGPITHCRPHIAESTRWNIVVCGSGWINKLIKKRRRANLFWLSFAVAHRTCASAITEPRQIFA